MIHNEYQQSLTVLLTVSCHLFYNKVYVVTSTKTSSTQQTDTTVAVTDRPVLPFGVHVLQQNVMYKDIPLTTLDIPHSLPLLVQLFIILGKGTNLQKGKFCVYLCVYSWLNCTDCG
jgi:hypothetical protein